MVRSIYTAEGRLAFDEVSKRYRSDLEFQQTVNRYIGDYERILADGDRRAMLKTITAPTLVVHGEADPLVPLAAGKDTAANIPGARLMTIPAPAVAPCRTRISQRCSMRVAKAQPSEESANRASVTSTTRRGFAG